MATKQPFGPPIHITKVALIRVVSLKLSYLSALMLRYPLQYASGILIGDLIIRVLTMVILLLRENSSTKSGAPTVIRTREPMITIP